MGRLAPGSGTCSDLLGSETHCGIAEEDGSHRQGWKSAEALVVTLQEGGCGGHSSLGSGECMDLRGLQGAVLGDWVLLGAGLGWGVHQARSAGAGALWGYCFCFRYIDWRGF